MTIVAADGVSWVALTLSVVAAVAVLAVASILRRTNRVARRALRTAAQKAQRGARGPPGTNGSNGTNGTNGTGGTSVQFEPQHTLFVSPDWPTGADPTVYFTTITAAIAQVLANMPVVAATDPCLILVFPGSYGPTTGEDATIFLRSNVHLAAVGVETVLITSNVEWDVGTGANLLNVAHPETMVLTNLVFTANVTETVSSSKGHGITSHMEMDDCRMHGLSIGAIGGNLSVTSRNAAEGDTFVAYDSSLSTSVLTIIGGGTWTFSSTTLTFGDASSIGAGGGPIAQFTLQGGAFFGGAGGAPLTLDGALVTCESTTLLGAWTTTSNVTIVATNCAFNSGMTLATDATSVAQLMGSQFLPAQISGCIGGVDRDFIYTAAFPTVSGSNVIPIAPPLVTTNYQVTFTQNDGGTSLSPPVITAFDNASVTFNASGTSQYSVGIQLSCPALL